MDRNIAHVGRAVDPIRASPFDFRDFRHFFGARRRIGAAPYLSRTCTRERMVGVAIHEDVTSGIDNDAPLETFNREAGDFRRAPGRELTDHLGAGITHIDVAVRIRCNTFRFCERSRRFTHLRFVFVFAPAQLEPIDDRVTPVDHVDRARCGAGRVVYGDADPLPVEFKASGGRLHARKPRWRIARRRTPSCTEHFDRVEVFTALRDEYVSSGFFDRQACRPFEGTEAVEIGRGRGQYARTRHRQHSRHRTQEREHCKDRSA